MNEQQFEVIDGYDTENNPIKMIRDNETTEEYSMENELEANSLCLKLNDFNDTIKLLNKAIELGLSIDLVENFSEWDEIITRLDKTNRRLVEIEETYQSESDRILAEARETEVDFKALYGANNKDVRQQYADEQLSDLLEEKKELEFTKADDNRRISFLKRLIDMKIQLIKYGVN